jgi:hypothetical protein
MEATSGWEAGDGFACTDAMQRPAKAPRRRDFKTVPIILDTPDLWDAEALDAIIAYRGSWKQVWDNVEIGGPWLNLRRSLITGYCVVIPIQQLTGHDERYYYTNRIRRGIPPGRRAA